MSMCSDLGLHSLSKETRSLANELPAENAAETVTDCSEQSDPGPDCLQQTSRE